MQENSQTEQRYAIYLKEQENEAFIGILNDVDAQDSDAQSTDDSDDCDIVNEPSDPVREVD
jgi:myo-inositol-hexaphosphate 3-phosphohydrolase